MKHRNFWRALMAALLCAALLCPALASAEDALILSDDAVAVNDAGEYALELELDDGFDGVVDLPDLDLNDDLSLDPGLGDAASGEIELPSDTQANDESTVSEPAAEDAVPLVASYTGDPLTKVFDCNSYGAYVKDGQTVYVIEELRTIKSKFRLAPASGYDWVAGHANVSFKLTLSKQFGAPDVGDYNFEFKLTLEGDDADYYTIQNPIVQVSASITPRPVVVTPRVGLSKVYGADDPVYPQGSWLSSDETSPLHQNVSGLPGYAVPVNKVGGVTKLTVDDGMNGSYILTNARMKGTKFFLNDGWLTREPGEKPGKYRITRGDMDFGPNFTIKIARQYFTIKRLNIADSDVTVSEIKDKTYTGKALTPAPVVRYNGKKLKLNTDYTLKYSGNQNPGAATVIISGKGNYTGTRKVRFKIVLKPTAISKLTAGKGQITVAWKKGSQNDGYQLSYSTAADFFDERTKKVNSANTTSLTLKSLQSRTTYYVRIRTWKKVKGSTYYSDWSKVKKISTK